MKFYAAFVCVLLSIACYRDVFAVHIRETATNTLWVNIPVSAEAAKQFVHPELEPSIYNGSAWFSIMLFKIDSLETSVFDHWVTIPGLNGLAGKISLLVNTVDGKRPGYLMLSEDFESGIAGSFQKMGCSKSQRGLKCFIASKMVQESNHAVWATEDQASMSVNYHVLDDFRPDEAFVKFIADRPFKFLQEGKTWLTYAEQEEKSNPRNFDVRSVSVPSISSDILAKRFGFSGIESSPLCQNGECFWGAWYRFVDNDNVPM